MNTILKLGPNSVVSQPGDPLLSPNGNVSVSANNDGTASITRPVSGGGTETRGLVIAPPYDAEIEYLQGDGLAYVDSGIQATNNDEIVIECAKNGQAEKEGVFGYRTSAQTDSCIVQVGSLFSDYTYYNAYFSNGSDFANYAIGGGDVAGMKTTDWVRFTISKTKREAVNLNTQTTIQSNTTAVAEVFTTVGNCLIFKNGGTPFATNCFTGKIRRIEWSRNGTPIRSFTPVRVGSVGYLYDRVSGALFGNAGTGDFVLGPDVNVHTALVRADANFDNIKHWFTDATFSFKPTITFKSGWSASLDVEFRIVNGRMAHVAGNIKCTSALTAGTSYTPFSAFSFPTGVNYYAGCRLGANQRVWIYFNGTSTTITPEVNIDANTNIYLRGLIPMTVNPDTAPSYVKRIAPLF